MFDLLCSMGVDGIITNYPERVSTVIMEGPFRRAVKLANPTDTPWKKVGVEVQVSGTPGSPVMNALGDVSEVFQQFWTYLVTRLTGRIFRSRTSRDSDEPPMSPRELAEQTYYRWLNQNLL